MTTPIADLLLTANADGQAAKANDLFVAGLPAFLYAKDPATTSGLTWGYIGGWLGDNEIANGTVALADDDDNYIVAARSDGTVSASTGTTDWNDPDYIRLYIVTTAAGAIAPDGIVERRQAIGAAGGSGGSVKVIQLSCSDLTTDLTTGTTKAYCRAPFDMSLSEVAASLLVAQPSGSIFTVDVNVNGSSILSTKLTIDNTETTSTTAATPAVISSPSITKDDLITIDIDQIGDTGATGLIVALIGI